MNEEKIKSKIIERAGDIAKILARDRDCELRRDQVKVVKILKVEKKEV